MLLKRTAEQSVFQKESWEFLHSQTKVLGGSEQKNPENFRTLRNATHQRRGLSLLPVGGSTGARWRLTSLTNTHNETWWCDGTPGGSVGWSQGSQVSLLGHAHNMCISTKEGLLM